MATQIDLRHLVPFIFIAVAVWVAVTVPGEGVTAYTDIVDSEFSINEATGYVYHNTATLCPFSVGWRYNNGTTLVWDDLLLSGTVNDFEYIFDASYTDTAAVAYLYFMTGYTVADLAGNSTTRMQLTLNMNDIGVSNPNITQVLVGSRAIDSPTTHNLAVYNHASPNEIQINESSVLVTSCEWTLPALLAYDASYTAEIVFVTVTFEAITAGCFDSEIMSGSIAFQYTGVSITQTWLYSILGSSGFLMGTIMLAPAAGLTRENYRSYNRSWKSRRWRGGRRWNGSRRWYRRGR